MRVKKICLLIHSLSPGGKERVMSELATFFAHKDNVELHLIIYGNKREIFYPLPDNIRIQLPNFKFNTRSRIESTIRTILFLRQTIRNIDPDSILSFGEYWNNLVLLSLFGLNCKIFISDRSQPGKNLGSFHNIIRQLFYRKAAGYIAQTNYAAYIAYKHKWNKNITIIGNPVRKILPFKEIKKEKIVLSVGRLLPTKHFDMLIRLFAEIDDPEWKLIIVGGDVFNQDVSNELEKLIHLLHLEDRILLEGVQSNIDMYYLKSQIFAFMSSSEGFPNVLCEALSAGMPVVAFDCIAGPSDLIINNKNGFLIPLFNYQEFKQKLMMLMKDDELRGSLAIQASESVEKLHIDVIGNSYYNFMTDSLK